MEFTNRSGWGAVAPTHVDKTTWSKRNKFAVHYSGASADQSVRSIQRFHMETRGWSDIGYNWLVHSVTGEIFEGRGWLVIGAHAAGHNTESIGVCVIGQDKAGRADNSPAALASVKRLYDEACKRAGRKLTVVGHRDIGNTDCPGDELYSWLKRGMPTTSTPVPPAETFTEKIMRQLPTMRIGDGNTKAVRTVQAIINRDGGHLLEDGVWRERTDAAVRAWQAEHDVPDSVTAAGHGDGIFGPACWTFALDM